MRRTSEHLDATPSRPHSGHHDTVVVGGGVIGLSVAWRAASSGLDVAVVDPDPGRGASWAAAGMLAPVTEAHYGEEALLALNLASARLWPSFASDLESFTSMSTGYRACGTLVVALGDGDRALAEQLFEFQRSLGLEVEWLSARSARQMEPNLSTAVRAAMLAAGDHQVDNRLLVAALLEAAQRSGCTVHRVRARALSLGGGKVDGVELEDGGVLGARHVVLAAGAWSTAIDGLPEGALPGVRPVKGQILRLSAPAAAPAGTLRTQAGAAQHALLGRSVRGLVNGNGIYLVPRLDGTVVVGATMEERGFDTSVTAGAVYDLLRDAHRVVPGISELDLAEALAGLRPGSLDNSPFIGPLAPGVADGLVVATGHHRGGILLAPLTSQAVAALLSGQEVPAEVAPFSPQRVGVPSWSR